VGGILSTNSLLKTYFLRRIRYERQFQGYFIDVYLGVAGSLCGQRLRADAYNIGYHEAAITNEKEPDNPGSRREPAGASQRHRRAADEMDGLTGSNALIRQSRCCATD
jgi:hypothetical protein